MTGPRVSVVMAAYNAQDYLGAAISSALTQTHPDVEVVVVDDGSTDDTYRVAQAYGDRITLVRQENAGCAAARNTAIAHASGDFIANCDSDDILMPHHVERCLRTLQEAPARTWVCADAVQLTDQGLGGSILAYGRIPPHAQREAILQANIATVFSFFPRALTDEVGLYDSRLRYAEDWDLWVRSILAGWRVRAVDTPTALYRVRSDSMSHHTTAMIEAEEHIFRSVREQLSETLTPSERAHIDRRLERGSARDLVRQSEECLAAGQWRGGAPPGEPPPARLPPDQRLQRKARLLKVFPRAGQLITHRRSRAS